MRIMIDTNILISAILGDVDLLLTGDKDFFAIEIDKPEIITAKDFWSNINRK